MSDPQPPTPEDSRVDEAAAAWTLRLDRGLSATEQDAYVQWLADDPRHRRAMAEHQAGWDELDRLAGLQTTRHARVDPDLLSPEATPWMHRRRIRPWWVAAPLAAAAMLALVVLRPGDRPAAELPEEQREVRLPPRIEVVTLSDGTEVQLNRGATLEAAFTGSERRVVLRSGEANFRVTRDPGRPFVVEVAGVLVQAVGTAFNVRRTDSLVDVIVTEGRVRLAADGAQASDPAGPPLLEPGQRGLVKLDAPAGARTIAVATLAPGELENELVWQPRLLDFDATPLPEIIAAFNRANPVQMVVGDPSLENLVLSSAFWSDNVEGFVRLMESSFSLRATRRDDGAVVLHPPR